MKQRSSGQLMIFLCVKVIGWHGDIHERSNCQNHEHQREAMSENRIIGDRADVGIVKGGVYFTVKVFDIDGVVPVRSVCGQ